MPWAERVHRTFRLSRTHFMAMLDMANFVYLLDLTASKYELTDSGRLR